MRFGLTLLAAAWRRGGAITTSRVPRPRRAGRRPANGAAAVADAVPRAGRKRSTRRATTVAKASTRRPRGLAAGRQAAGARIRERGAGAWGGVRRSGAGRTGANEGARGLGAGGRGSPSVGSRSPTPRGLGRAGARQGRRFAPGAVGRMARGGRGRGGGFVVSGAVSGRAMTRRFGGGPVRARRAPPVAVAAGAARRSSSDALRLARGERVACGARDRAAGAARRGRPGRRRFSHRSGSRSRIQLPRPPRPPPISRPPARPSEPEPARPARRVGRGRLPPFRPMRRGRSGPLRHAPTPAAPRGRPGAIGGRDVARHPPPPDGRWWGRRAVATAPAWRTGGVRRATGRRSPAPWRGGPTRPPPILRLPLARRARRGPRRSGSAGSAPASRRAVTPAPGRSLGPSSRFLPPSLPPVPSPAVPLPRRSLPTPFPTLPHAAPPVLSLDHG